MMLVVLLSSCNSKWDDYFFSSTTDENMEITVAEYIASQPEYSKFKDMLVSTGLDKEREKG